MRLTLRNELLLWLGLPLLLLWALSVLTHYESALAAANLAYDRSLLASARTVAERLVVRRGHLEVEVPWVVLDSFERNMDDRLFYQVISPEGKTLSGYQDLPPIPADNPMATSYPALVHFYNATYQSLPIRIAALWQPVSEQGFEGMALVIVGETLNSRVLMAAGLLRTALWSQGVLVLATLLLASLMLRRLLRPLRRLSRLMLHRDASDLTPLPSLLPWSELQPLVMALNRYMARLRALLARQERFSGDAAHQLRTPLAILKTQVTVALNSEEAAQRTESLLAMRNTLDDTIQLTDRLLQLSRVKGRQSEQQPMQQLDLTGIVRDACLTRYSQARSKQIDLGYEGDEHCVIMGDPLLLAELCANLLDNAIKYTPPGGVVTASVVAGCVKIEDSGPGIAQAQRQQALQPFQRLQSARLQQGAGLGLALVNDIAQWHGTQLTLGDSATLGGLCVQVVFRLC